jgi:hypothetical protein
MDSAESAGYKLDDIGWFLGSELRSSRPPSHPAPDLLAGYRQIGQILGSFCEHTVAATTRSCGREVFIQRRPSRSVSSGGSHARESSDTRPHSIREYRRPNSRRPSTEAVLVDDERRRAALLRFGERGGPCGGDLVRRGAKNRQCSCWRSFAASTGEMYGAPVKERQGWLSK